jgi:hypothetical protein
MLLGKEYEQLILESIFDGVTLAWYCHSFAFAGGCMLLDELLDAVIRDILCKNEQDQ